MSQRTAGERASHTPSQPQIQESRPMSWIAKIGRVGRIVEPADDAPATTVAPPTGVGGSLQLRHVDAGSCNGCELEITGAFCSVYDAERFGARIVGSPRHADGLIATGVVTRNMHRLEGVEQRLV